MYLYAGYLSELEQFFVTFSNEAQTSTFYLSEKEIKDLEYFMQRAKIRKYNSIINPIEEINTRSNSHE